MTGLRKKLIAYGMLSALTVWPCVHIVLARTYGLSPWKLAGWGMYSAPRMGAGFQVLARTGPDDEFQPMPVPPEAMELARTFYDRRRWLGGLVVPDALGAAVLASDPELHEVAILVEQPYLSTETAHIESTHELYRYER